MTSANPKPTIVIIQRLLPHYRIPFFRALVKHNHDLEVCVYYGETSGVGDISGFESRKFHNSKLNLLQYSLVFQIGLMWAVLRSRPDVVVIEGTFGVLTNFFILVIRRMMGLPTLYWTAGWDNPGIQGWRLAFKTLFIRVCLFLCNGAIVYGSAARQYLVRHGLSSDKIMVAQNTVDVEAIIAQGEYWKQQGELVRKRFQMENEYLISYIGQLSPIKRVPVLLEAFRTLRSKRKDISLLLVGSGTEDGRLQQHVTRNHIPNVHFAGEVVEGVEAYFAASNVFILPGTGGLALNQAMALCLPIVATVADGTQDDLVIQGENGYVVPVDNESALVEAIEMILSSPERCKMMGDASLRIVQERATLRNMVEQYSQALRRACKVS